MKFPTKLATILQEFYIVGDRQCVVCSTNGIRNVL